jgi:Mu-like prophage I protein
MTQLDTDTRNALADSDFAYIDSKGERHLPINDADHVRNALARFDQTQFESDTAKSEAHAKLLAAAKRLGVDVSKKKQADDPGAGDAGPGDVHVDAPVNGTPTGKKRSPLLKRLMRGLRKRITTNRYLTAEDLETEYRSALGHAGGASRSAAEPADDEVCPACQAAGHGAADGCTCPACQEGDPSDCECLELLDQDDDVDPSQASERHWFEVTAASGESLHLFMEAKSFADAPGFINILPKPGLYKSPRYGEIPISAERNANFVKNFKAGVYQTRVPIDAEHETKLSGALGWITDTRQNEDGSVDAQVDWTDRGRLMLANDRFKYFSPEWFDAWVDPATEQQHSDVLIGGALTSRPFFKENSLRPLVASETGIRIGDDPTLVQPLPDEGTTTPRPHGQEKNQMTESIQLTEDEIKRFREMDSELAESRKAVEAAQTQANQATERAAALERENRRRTFAEQASTWHGETAKHVDFMEALPSDELRQQYAEQQASQATALAEAQKQASLFTTVGVSGHESADSAMGKLNAAAETIRASEPTLTIEQARARAVKGNPKLYEAYEAEIAG